MATGTVGVLQPGGADRLIDNENIDDAGTPKYRQRIRIGGVNLTDLAGCDAANGLDVDVTRVTGTVTVDSELPAAAAMADAAANMTVPTVGVAGLGYNGTTWDRLRVGSPTAEPGNVGVFAAQLHISDGTNIIRLRTPEADALGNRMLPAGSMLYNGSTWDRMRGDTTNGLDVDVTRVSGSVAVTGTFWQATQPVSGTVSVSGTVTVDSELPAAAALSDTIGNPTTAMVGAANMVWDGASNWIRVRGDATNGLDVDVTRVSGNVAVTGTFWQATQPVSGTFWQATQPVSGTFWQATQPVSIAATVTVDTELPAAAALSDTIGNPTTAMIGGANMCWDGSTNWIRVRGDATNGLDVDVTRVTGTVTISGAVTVSSGSITADTELPAAAALSDTTGNPTTAMVGSASMCWDGASNWIRVRGDATNGLDVDVTRVSGSVAVTGTFWQATQPVSGTVSISGAVDTELPAAAALSDTIANPTTAMVGGANMCWDGATNWIRVRGDATNGLDVDVTRVSGSVAVTGTFWQATQPVSGTVTITPSGTQTTKEIRAATPTQTSVASSATNVTIVASNGNRLGATIYNDSTQILYLKLGATASATSYTIQMAAGGYFEVPFAYTGIIDGIWASANGNARITEIAA